MERQTQNYIEFRTRKKALNNKTTAVIQKLCVDLTWLDFVCTVCAIGVRTLTFNEISIFVE